MNLRELKELIDLVQSSQVTELEIEKAGVRVKIKRGIPPQIPLQPSPSAVSGTTPQFESAREIQIPTDLYNQKGLVTIKAPVVGTFYRSSSQDAAPYVEIGTSVSKGQILCIIEAMKLMNEIEAEYDGKISVILVENGQSVEYGQPLFLIEPMTVPR